MLKITYVDIINTALYLKSFTYLVILVYVIVWVAAVFGINCASNAGRKLVIVRGATKHYYILFPACITSAINSSKPYCYNMFV